MTVQLNNLIALQPHALIILKPYYLTTSQPSNRITSQPYNLTTVPPSNRPTSYQKKSDRVLHSNLSLKILTFYILTFTKKKLSFISSMSYQETAIFLIDA